MLIILALLVQDDKLLDVIQKHPLGVNCVPFQRVSEFVGLNSLPVFVLAENVPHRGFGLVSNRKTTYRKLLLFDYLIQTCVKSFCIRTLPCITPSFTLSFYIQIYITFTEALTKKKNCNVFLSAGRSKWSFSRDTLLSSIWILNKRLAQCGRKCHLSH